jgi:hypothetical protein
MARLIMVGMTDFVAVVSADTYRTGIQLRRNSVGRYALLEIGKRK